MHPNYFSQQNLNMLKTSDTHGGKYLKNFVMTLRTKNSAQLPVKNGSRSNPNLSLILKGTVSRAVLGLLMTNGKI